MFGSQTAMRVHLEQLALHWSEMDIPFDKIILMSPGELHLERIHSMVAIETRTIGKRFPPLLWEQLVLPRAARGLSALLSFYTCPLSYNGRIVVSNHGIYEAIPSAFTWWERKRATPINRRSPRRADWVIANSLNTMGDLVRFFGVPESKIDVIYEGPGDVFYERYSEETIADEVIKVFGERVPYVLFVGKIVKRRHLPNLIEAFSIVRSRASLPHRLLIVGPNSSNIPIEELAKRHGIAQAVRNYPHLPQGRLAKLYAGADVFALPTTYEGISRTIYEAMASGTPVLTVDHPTLSEGGADAVLSVPTPSVEDLVQGLSALLTNNSLRKNYEEKGRARIGRFSMRECAKATMAVLDKVALPSNRHD